MICSTSCRFRQRHAAAASFEDANRLFEQGQLAAAFDLTERGTREFQSTQPDWSWKFRILQGQILLWRGLAKDSLAELQPEPPPNLSSSETAAKRLIFLAFADSLLQHFDSAEHSLSDAHRLTDKYPDLLSYEALAKGTLLLLRGDYDGSGKAFRQSLNAARDLKQTFVEANALGNLGVLATRRAHYDEAIDDYDECLAVARKLKNEPLQAKTQGNLGWNYLKMGDFDRALSLSENALTGASRIGQLKDEQIWLTNIGLILFEQRDFARAKESFHEALEVARKLDNQGAVAISLNNLALVAIKEKQYSEAEKYNHEALEIKIANHDRSSQLYSILNQGVIEAESGLPAEGEKHMRQVIDGADQDVSLQWQAKVELARTYAATGDVHSAARQFQACMVDADVARRAIKKEEYRLSFLNTATDFYNDYIDFLISQGRIEEALAVAEHSRARTLAEGLGIKPASLEENKMGATEIARRQHAVILAYWLKPQRSYLWAITPKKISLFTLPDENEINAAVQGYRKALTGPRDPLDTANAAGQQLYEMLIAPAVKLIPPNSRVVIIAEGPLYGLNFETLLAPAPKLHYWIDDVTISNANSLAMLGTQPSPEPSATKPSLLLIGNPASASPDFPPLPQAEEEIHEVAAHFPNASETVIDGPKATPASYLASNPLDFSYIHFVAHGTASHLSPLDSAVILSPEGESYKLYARDIVEKPLRADLVTISACYGSGNRAYSGEGLVGLSWAFLRAGARNVVAALWEANDVSTPKLMDAMYSGIDRGDDPSTALRNAKLALLHSDSIYRRPFYWAPFQLYVGPGQTSLHSAESGAGAKGPGHSGGKNSLNPHKY